MRLSIALILASTAFIASATADDKASLQTIVAGYTYENGGTTCSFIRRSFDVKKVNMNHGRNPYERSRVASTSREGSGSTPVHWDNNEPFASYEVAISARTDTTMIQMSLPIDQSGQIIGNQNAELFAMFCSELPTEDQLQAISRRATY